jgi:NADPH:quinone reductase-like Zn-dependent oxidoreductase
VESGQLRVAIDSIFALAEAAAAFERSLALGKHGKVVIGRHPATSSSRSRLSL